MIQEILKRRYLINGYNVIFRYIQLKNNDVMKFGLSSRKYVLFHDQAKGSQENDSGIILNNSMALK